MDFMQWLGSLFNGGQQNASVPGEQFNPGAQQVAGDEFAASLGFPSEGDPITSDFAMESPMGSKLARDIGYAYDQGVSFPDYLLSPKQKASSRMPSRAELPMAVSARQKQLLRMMQGGE